MVFYLVCSDYGPGARNATPLRNTLHSIFINGKLVYKNMTLGCGTWYDTLPSESLSSVLKLWLLS